MVGTLHRTPSWENLKQWAPVGRRIVELTLEPSNSVMVWQNSTKQGSDESWWLGLYIEPLVVKIRNSGPL